jgi:hypothetical protein
MSPSPVNLINKIMQMHLEERKKKKKKRKEKKNTQNSYQTCPPNYM